MSGHGARLDRLESYRRRSQRARTFIPVGIVHTDAQDAWLAEERRRRGLAEHDDLLAFSWMPGEAA